jgi:catechol 2,3-dioxygenase-like lactoylglutathione lyase family enzyme
MAVELNHTIVHAKDKRTSADFLAGILGLEVDPPAGPFLPVVMSNGVALDFMDTDEVLQQHYAFKLDAEEWEAAHARLLDQGVRTWADPSLSRPDAVYEHGGERGAYFMDPSGHLMEILTAR